MVMEGEDALAVLLLLKKQEEVMESSEAFDGLQTDERAVRTQRRGIRQDGQHALWRGHELIQIFPYSSSHMK